MAKSTPTAVTEARAEEKKLIKAYKADPTDSQAAAAIQAGARIRAAKAAGR